MEKRQLGNAKVSSFGLMSAPLWHSAVAFVDPAKCMLAKPTDLEANLPQPGAVRIAREAFPLQLRRVSDKFAV